MNSKLQFIKSRIYEGQIVSDWKELCSLLDEPYKPQTHSKDSQRKDWNQYFEFEKVEGTRKIKVTKIYDKMKPNFKSKGSKLPEYLDPAIFINLEAGEFVTRAEVARRVKLASKVLIDFHSDKESWKQVVRWLNNNDEVICGNEDNLWAQRKSKSFKRISYYISKVQSSYKSSFDSAMDRLQKMELIKYEPVTVLVFPNDYTSRITGVLETEGIDALKDVLFPWIYEDLIQILEESPHLDYTEELDLILKDYDMVQGHSRKATDKEQNFLENIGENLCNEKGYPDLKSLISASCWDMDIRKEYFDELTKRVSKYGIKTYEAYGIIDVNNNVEVNMGSVQKLNETFYELRIKTEKASLNKDFEEEWKKTHFLKDSKRIKSKYDEYGKTFDEFADEFIKL